MKLVPRLGAGEFDRLANATQLRPRAREMARLALVEGHSMHEVAKNFDTIPQRVHLAVGSIHRVQAALTWHATALPVSTVPERLLVPLSELVASFNALRPAQLDDAMIAELQAVLGQVRRQISSL